MEDRRSDAVVDAGSSIVEHERWLQTAAPAILDELAAYSRTDCLSTSKLRDWLEERRGEYAGMFGAEAPRPRGRDGPVGATAPWARRHGSRGRPRGRDRHRRARPGARPGRCRGTPPRDGGASSCATCCPGTGERTSPPGGSTSSDRRLPGRGLLRRHRVPRRARVRRRCRRRPPVGGPSLPVRPLAGAQVRRGRRPGRPRGRAGQAGWRVTARPRHHPSDRAG